MESPKKAGYLYEKLKIFANVNEIQILIEAKHVDTAARTARIENDNVTLTTTAAVNVIGGEFTVGERID